MLSTERTIGSGKDKHPVRRMGAGIGASSVFLEMKARMSHCANRAPVKLAEMNDQVGGHVAQVTIDLRGLEDERLQGLAVSARQRLQFRFHLVLERLILGRRDHSLRL